MDEPLQGADTQAVTKPVYCPVEVEGASLRVLREGADAIVAALLHPSAGKALEGGRAQAFKHETAAGPVVVRPMRRGGLVRHVLRDTYLVRNRPLAEFENHVKAYTRGVSVPQPLGVVWRQPAYGMYAGALATRWLRAQTLAACIKTGAAIPVEALVEAIDGMHSAGVWHADLNANNILIGEGDEGLRVYLIDFDRAMVRSAIPMAWRAGNWARLRRSFVKLGLPMEAYDALLKASANG